MLNISTVMQYCHISELPQSSADDTVAIVSIALSFLFVFLLIILMAVCYGKIYVDLVA